MIRFLPQGENQVCFFGNYNAGSYTFTAGKSSVRENMKYLSAVRKIEVGSQVRELGDYCFWPLQAGKHYDGKCRRMGKWCCKKNAAV